MGSFIVSPEIRAVLSDADRLRALYDLALIDSEEEVVYNRITQLARDITGAPSAVMSMVGDEYQFFKSAVGMGTLRSTPLSHAFCKHVVADNSPLIVEDARRHPVLFDNGSLRDYNVIGYLGFPLTIASGKTLGSFCVVDRQPRAWSEMDIEIMRELAEIVKYEIEVRALVRKGTFSSAQLDEVHDEIIAFADSLNPTEPKDRLLTLIRSQRRRLFGEA